jgi:lysophospholipase L1-like esterase
MRFINKKQIAVFFMALVVSFTPIIQLPVTAHALTKEQKKLYKSNILYYDHNYAKNECSVISTAASNGNVYVVGDSYSEGMQSAGLEAKLKDQGYTNITINGHTGRSINTPGIKPNESSATTAIEADADKIKAAGTILIVLGTNNDDYDKSIPVFMKKINEINGGARKFWVNIGNKQQPASYITERNATINKYVSTFDYSVIDWGLKFSNTPSLSGGLHPTPQGYKVLVDMVAAAFGKAEGASTGSGVAAKTDGTNAEVIWAYLIGKGLTPTQVAGIMGNMQAEAGFEPRRVQYGTKNSRGETSKAGDPSSLDDNVPTSSGGYGIVQWTYSVFKDDLRDYAQKKGVSAGNLQLQLDFLWEQLTDKRPYSLSYILTAVKKTTTVEEATKAFLTKYEKPCAGKPNEATCYEEKMTTRLPLAEKILKEYGGIGGQSFGCEATLSGVGGWVLTGTNAMTYYSQQDKKWANTKYGTCTIGEGGCGPTSAAMIIATLTGNKTVTPPIISAKLEDLGAVPACGTDWDKWSELMKGYNLKLKNIAKDFDQASKALNEGGLVLASFGIDGDTASKFTSGRHLMVIRKVSADGKYSIADPIDLNRFSNKETYTKEELLSRDPGTGGALNNMWAVTK